LRWSALFHDIGKLEAEQKEDGKTHFHGHAEVGASVMARKLNELKFSNKAKRYVKTLIYYHMRPLSLFCEEKVTQKAFYRLFRATGELTPVVCILSATDVVSTRKMNEREDEIGNYLDYIKSLIDRYEQMSEEATDPLLDGEEVMKLLDISPGPLVGKILNKLREAQALGELSTEEDAVEYVKNLNY
jgi:tRNA nucleotidyltransferase/poly(A) polymerase